MGGRRSGNANRDPTLALVADTADNRPYYHEVTQIRIEKLGNLMSTKELSERPSKVILAVRMLYLVVAIGIIRTAMTVIRHADVRSPHFLIETKALVYVASLFLIYQIGKGKNWARWYLVAILAIAIPLTILPNFESYSHNPVHMLLGFLQLALYIVALVFLFHGSSSHWFGAGKIPK